MSIRRTLNQIARTQQGLITFDDALGAGLTPWQVRDRLRSGEWQVVRPRVYAVGGAPATWLQAVAAVTLSVQPGAWLSHRTAAQLWGLPGIKADRIEVVTDLGRRVRLDGVLGHRSGAMFTADLSRRHGIPVTSPARTIVDVSGTVPEPRLGVLVDHALRARVLRLDELRRCVARLGEGPGRRLASVHALLAQRLPGYDPGDSDLETRVLRAVIAAGLPAPVQQYRVRVRGRTFRIDLAYPDWRLAIELDGWEFHRTRTAFDGDRARANVLVAAGWSLVRFTSRSTDADILATVRACGQSGAA